MRFDFRNRRFLAYGDARYRVIDKVSASQILRCMFADDETGEYEYLDVNDGGKALIDLGKTIKGKSNIEVHKLGEGEEYAPKCGQWMHVSTFREYYSLFSKDFPENVVDKDIKRFPERTMVFVPRAGTYRNEDRDHECFKDKGGSHLSGYFQLGGEYKPELASATAFEIKSGNPALKGITVEYSPVSTPDPGPTIVACGGVTFGEIFKRMQGHSLALPASEQRTKEPMKHDPVIASVAEQISQQIRADGVCLVPKPNLWTATPPSSEGFYWLRARLRANEYDSKPIVVRVFLGKSGTTYIQKIGSSQILSLLTIGGEWWPVAIDEPPYHPDQCQLEGPQPLISEGNAIAVDYATLSDDRLLEMAENCERPEWTKVADANDPQPLIIDSK